MKILYTTHQFYPDFGAGTELLTYMTADHVRKRGHSVRIVTGCPLMDRKKSGAIFDEYTYNELSVHRYRHSSFDPTENQCIMEAEHCNKTVQKWFQNILQKFKPDLVHVFHLQRLSAGILETCYQNGVPFIITTTDFWMVCPTTQLLLPDNTLCLGPHYMMANCVKHLSQKTSNTAVRYLVSLLPESFIRGMIHFLNKIPRIRIGPFRNIFALTKRPEYVIGQINRARCVLVTNHFMKKMLEKHGMRSNIIKLMPFGIEPINPLKDDLKRDYDTLNIGFIGTLNFHKGVHVPIKALRALPQSVKIQLKIYGSREQFPEYVSLLDKTIANDTRISFLGTFEPDRIGTVLQGIDILVIPSLWYENTPLILHQAQAAKVPVIATDLGGMNEMIEDGKNGFLIKPGQDKELATLFDHLASNPERIDLLRQHIRAPLFIDEYANRLETLYSNICAVKERKPIHEC